MIWYCESCKETIHVSQNYKPPCIKQHKEKILGIREDIFADTLARLVADLKRTGRLERFKS